MGNLAAETIALRATRSECLAIMPEIALKVMELSQSATAAPRDLALWVEREPSLAAKVLKVANSAMYSTGTPISSIARAVGMLGTNTLRSIVVSIAYQHVSKHQPSAQYFDIRALWSHSLATAIAARTIASKVAPEIREQMYLAGLLHDIGILMMDRLAPGALDQIIDAAQKHQCSLDQVEMQVLGFTHCDLGAIVAKNWGFESLIINPIRHHHDPEADAEHPIPSAIVAAANSLAVRAGLLNQSPIPVETPTAFEKLGLDQAACDEIITDIISDLSKLQLTLGVSLQ